jgi:hypothetical protein
MMNAPTLRTVARAKHLLNLTLLDVSGHCLFTPDPYAGEDEDDVDTAACKRVLPKLGEKMPALRELQLDGTGLHDDDVNRLVQQAWVSRLRVLDLSSNGITDEGCRALCESKNLANLEQINLTHNNTFDATANAKRPFRATTIQLLKERFGKGVVL